MFARFQSDLKGLALEGVTPKAGQAYKALLVADAHRQVSWRKLTPHQPARPSATATSAGSGWLVAATAATDHDGGRNNWHWAPVKDLDEARDPVHHLQDQLAMFEPGQHLLAAPSQLRQAWRIGDGGLTVTFDSDIRAPKGRRLEAVAEILTAGGVRTARGRPMGPGQG